MPNSFPDRPEIITRRRHSLLHRFRLWYLAHRAVADPQWGLNGRNTFRAGVSGDLPQASADGIVLGACNDLYYWKFAITLVLSIEQHGEPVTMHLHLCNPGPETIRHITRVSSALSSVRLTWTRDDGRLANGLPYRSVYLTSMRFLMAAWILEETRCPILCLDVDAIAVRPIGPSFTVPAGSPDVALIRRPEQRRTTRKIQAGAACFNPTPGGMRYASALARALAASFGLALRYHVDQSMMYQVMARMQAIGALTVAQMPGTMADATFSPDAAIWMPKGWALKNSDLYADAKRSVDERFPELARR